MFGWVESGRQGGDVRVEAVVAQHFAGVESRGAAGWSAS
jgi:hypothetical protein